MIQQGIWQVMQVWYMLPIYSKTLLECQIQWHDGEAMNF